MSVIVQPPGVESVEARPRGTALSTLRRWAAEPRRFVRDVFGVTPDGWQDHGLDRYPKVPRLCLKACVNPGKTFLLAMILWHFIVTRPFCNGAATSISLDNLRDNLWKELALWRARSKLISGAFGWHNRRIYAKEHPATWWISARTWQRSADAETQGNTLAGLHAKRIIAVADETGGYPSAVLKTAEGILAGGEKDEAHLIQAGNPTHRSGPLFEACHRAADLWEVISVSGDPDDPNRAPRVDLEWAKQQIRVWGRTHPFVWSKILGMFPDTAADAILGVSDFEDAWSRDEAEVSEGAKVLGVDVAISVDRSVICFRDGEICKGFEAWSGTDPAATADKVERAALDFGAERVVVDDIGVGAGVTANLKRMTSLSDLGVEVQGINVGTKSHKKGPKGEPMYQNLRAQLHLEARKRFRDGAILLDSSTRSTTLMEEGTDIRYGYADNGKTIKVEKKEAYRERHEGRSPDFFDAFLLAFGDVGPTPTAWAV